MFLWEYFIYLGLVSTFVWGLYPLFDVLLKTYFPKSYKNLPNSERIYVVKNLIKAFMLFIWCIIAWYIIYGAIIDNWNNFVISWAGVLYAAPDLVGLIRVKKLERSTRIHHICVNILAALNVLNDYQTYTFWRGVVIYASISVLTFSVNLYLGLRKLNFKYSHQLCLHAYYTYGLLLALNWSYQLHIMYRTLMITGSEWMFYLYGGMIGMIVYDDIKLISFLRHMANK